MGVDPDFAGIENTQITKSSSYFKPGSYDVIVKSCSKHTNRKGVRMFIAECEVLTSDNPEHKVRSRAAWFLPLGDKDRVLKEMTVFVASAYGFRLPDDNESFDLKLRPRLGEVITASLNAEAIVNCKLHLDVTTKVSKNDVEYSKHAWSPFVDA